MSSSSWLETLTPATLLFCESNILFIMLFVFRAEVDTLEVERLPMQGGLCIIILVNTSIWTEGNLRPLNVKH
jgi:hypothetical protein